MLPAGGVRPSNHRTGFSSIGRCSWTGVRPGSLGRHVPVTVFSVCMQPVEQARAGSSGAGGQAAAGMPYF